MKNKILIILLIFFIVLIISVYAVYNYRASVIESQKINNEYIKMKNIDIIISRDKYYKL